MNSSDVLEVSVVRSNENERELPLLVRFSGAVDKELEEALNSEGQAEQPSIQVQDDSQKSSCLSVDVGAATLSGKSDSSSPVKYFVCAVDRKKKTMKVSHVRSLFLLSRADTKPRTETEPSDDAVTKAELVQQFGGKRGKRSLQNKIEGRVTTEKIAEDEARALQNTISSQVGKISTESAIVTQDLPPHNPNTDKVDETYPLEGLITASEWKEVESTAELVASFVKANRADEAKQKYGLLDITLQVLGKALSETSEPFDEGVRRKIQSAVYLNYLLRFSSGVRGVSKRTASLIIQEATSAPIKTAERLSIDFMQEDAATADRSRLIRGQKDSDRLIMYCLVLWLTAVGFSDEITEIYKALRLTLTKCKTYFKHLGCKLTKGIKASGTGRQARTIPAIATLEAPLVFPQATKRQRKG
ncbi:hypothetical protein NDN08_007948 [Rhodosorus marinus]|uniref:DNA-directed RNA polymerase I subunit RPA49 n=1 Tax=Rhodosorus marinus TaxID=101924 RepID=A0AAV8UZC1_9RHOD|nr:hypothetical protein NDN08_007948 [Rhodosorus marinus]